MFPLQWIAQFNVFYDSSPIGGVSALSLLQSVRCKQTVKMAEGLVVEFQKFNKNARHLKRLQRETLQSIEDVGLSGNLSEGKLVLFSKSFKEVCEGRFYGSDAEGNLSEDLGNFRVVFSDNKVFLLDRKVVNVPI